MPIGKPQIRSLINPILPRLCFVKLTDGREGTVVDHPSTNRERLVMFEGAARPVMIPIRDFVGGRPNGGSEFTVFYDSAKPLREGIV